MENYFPFIKHMVLITEADACCIRMVAILLPRVHKQEIMLTIGRLHRENWNLAQSSLWSCKKLHILHADVQTCIWLNIYLSLFCQKYIFTSFFSTRHVKTLPIPSWRSRFWSLPPNLLLHNYNLTVCSYTHLSFSHLPPPLKLLKTVEICLSLWTMPTAEYC